MIRKVFFIVILLLVDTNAFSQEGKMTILDIIKNDKWSVSEGVHNSLPLVIRFRNEFLQRPDISQHPHLIKVNWPYLGGQSGMPDHSTSEKMGLFEDHLTAAVENDGSAVLAAVITNDGAREWAYYSSNVQEFANRLTNMPQEKERYPIELSTENDPSWEFLYKQILSGMSDSK